MPIELPMMWIVVLNVTGWLVIQLGLAWAFMRMPLSWFNPKSDVGTEVSPPRATSVFGFNPGGAGGWEQGGRFYERVLFIKHWKGRLPNAERWFGGAFPKGSLAGTDPDYLRRFIRETWRGELCHWLAMACAPLFFLWNPWWGGLINVGYAVAANLPCILTQRYNRIRFQHLVAGRERKGRAQKNDSV